MKITRLSGILALAVLLRPPFSQAQGPVDRRLPASRDGTVKISSAVGRLTVRGWGRDSVAVTGSLADPAARLEFTSEGRETRIRVVLPRETDVSAVSGLEVYVPRGTHVAARTSSGDIEVSEVEGGVDLESVSGAITVSGRPTMVYAETAGGDIAIDALTKVIRASSLNGDVSVTGARGYVEVSTVGGRARVVGADVWEGEITSVSGAILFTGSFDPNGSFYFETHSGDIELNIPADSHLDFDLTTIFSGSVTNDFAASDDRVFSVGGGGTQVRIKTFKGHIRILESAAKGS